MPRSQIANATTGKVKIHIRSEYEPLQTVLVHTPGREIDRLTPENMTQLLFEDVPFLPRMQREHQDFVDILKGEGVRVLQLRELLQDIMEEEEVRGTLVTLSCGAAVMPSLASIIQEWWSPREIGDLLLEGLTAHELYEHTGIQLVPTNQQRFGTAPDPTLGAQTERNDFFLLDPLPNAYFTRDPGVAVGSRIVSCKMHYAARVRESIIVREIFRRHPFFRGTKLLYGRPGGEDRPYTIEGGDIIVLSRKAVAVGCSERTRGESINRLARQLFKHGLAERVYEIGIPAKRAYMHLDTVFTVVDEGLVVTYPDVMREVTSIRRYEPKLIPGEGADEIHAFAFDENRNFNTILQDEYGHLEVIKTGNDKQHFASREQRADGTNVFALGPRKVVTYDRNPHTNEALRAVGVEVISFDGSELVRGLGGPRCMTMPIHRGIMLPPTQDDA